MSWPSIAFLGACTLTSIGIISYVHWKQSYDREQLHLGVIRDVERQRRRKAENIFRLREQIEITQQYQRNNPNTLDKT